jgi:cyanophycinase-like exopeptidase
MELVKIVAGMTGFYFGGGDQDQLKNVLSKDNIDSPVLAMIRKRWLDGMRMLLGFTFIHMY